MRVGVIILLAYAALAWLLFELAVLAVKKAEIFSNVGRVPRILATLFCSAICVGLVAYVWLGIELVGWLLVRLP